MLDLLQLAQPPPLIPNLLREERFNQLMSKLRERNILNDVFIKKYLKKASRKNNKIQVVDVQPQRCDSIKSWDSEKEQIVEIISSKNFSNQDRKTSFKLIPPQNSLKNTNHTLASSDKEEDDHISNFPNIEKAQVHLHKYTQPNYPFNQDHLFNKYLKDIFMKGASSKKIVNRNEPRKSLGRIKTQGKCQKYQLSIKSLVFENLVERQRLSQKVSKKYIREGAIQQKCQNISKYERISPFQDDKLWVQGTLPTLHHQTTKNKRFLQNFIRYNNDRFKMDQNSNQQSISIGKDICPSKVESLVRMGLSLRIQTIPMQKPF